MITIGSISRQSATQQFDFLAEQVRGRRKMIKDFTHNFPEFVFWIYPDGQLFDARDAHKQNVPKGYDYILDDEPDYGGFLRGRVARQFDKQIIVIYCREEALANDDEKIEQFLVGMDQLPIPINEQTLVVSDNGDIYGSIEDIETKYQSSN